MTDRHKFTISYSRTLQITPYQPTRIGASMAGYEGDSMQDKYNKCKAFVEKCLKEAESEHNNSRVKKDE